MMHAAYHRSCTRLASLIPGLRRTRSPAAAPPGATATFHGPTPAAAVHRPAVCADCQGRTSRTSARPQAAVRFTGFATRERPL